MVRFSKGNSEMKSLDSIIKTQKRLLLTTFDQRLTPIYCWTVSQRHFWFVVKWLRLGSDILNEFWVKWFVFSVDVLIFQRCMCLLVKSNTYCILTIDYFNAKSKSNLQGITLWRFLRSSYFYFENMIIMKRGRFRRAMDQSYFSRFKSCMS